MSRKSRDASSPWLARIARASWATWLLVALELGVALAFGARELAGSWEVQHGLTYLAPTALIAGSLIAVLGALLTWLVEHSEQPPVRGLLAALVLGAASALGWGVGGGRHLASMGQRGGFALLVGALAAVAAWAFVPALARSLRERPARCFSAVVGAVVLAEVINHRVLPRLYPAFHLGLGLFALLLSPLAAEALARWIPGSRPLGSSRRASWATGLVALLAALLVLPSAARLARFDNFRFVVSERAPIAGRVVELVTWVTPVAPEDRVSCDALPPEERAAHAACQTENAVGSARSLDLRDRDFLLISVDALRADHLGCYGYGRPTTPYIDALARESVLFEHAYAPTPHTSYSVTSLMTGKYMRPLLLQGVAQDSDTWASLLQNLRL